MVKPNGPLNTKFRELLLLVFNFQITLFNDIFVNIWKSVRPTILQYPTSFLSLSRLFFFFCVSLSCTLFLNILYSFSFFFCFFFHSFLFSSLLNAASLSSSSLFSFSWVWMTCDAIWLLSLYSHAIFSWPPLY